MFDFVRFSSCLGSFVRMYDVVAISGRTLSSCFLSNVLTGFAVQIISGWIRLHVFQRERFQDQVQIQRHTHTKATEYPRDIGSKQAPNSKDAKRPKPIAPTFSFRVSSLPSSNGAPASREEKKQENLFATAILVFTR